MLQAAAVEHKVPKSHFLVKLEGLQSGFADRCEKRHGALFAPHANTVDFDPAEARGGGARRGLARGFAGQHVDAVVLVERATVGTEAAVMLEKKRLTRPRTSSGESRSETCVKLRMSQNITVSSRFSARMS